ncbi:MAG: beta-propeller fold lactonase family protein, partial [Deltaproteobacteria bacterium]|nr:beta-propeller fold lactonase family protein [Deltaproteobacteria bacterium]
MANWGSNDISVYTINVTTGALTAGTAVAAGTNPASVAVDPSGKFVYAANGGSNNISVYTINTTTGALTAGTTVAAGTSPDSIAVDPSGKFAYAANWDSNNISVYTINAATGALTAGTAGVLLWLGSGWAWSDWRTILMAVAAVTVASQFATSVANLV